MMPPENAGAAQEPAPENREDDVPREPQGEPRGEPRKEPRAETPKMRKRRLPKDDGRYIIFFDFETDDAEAEGGAD